MEDLLFKTFPRNHVVNEEDAEPCAWIPDIGEYMESNDGLYAVEPMQVLCSPQRQAEERETPDQACSGEMRRNPFMVKGAVPRVVPRGKHAEERVYPTRDLPNGAAYRAFTLLQVVLLLPTVHRRFLKVQDKSDVGALRFSTVLRSFVSNVRGYLEAIAEEYGLRVSKVRMCPRFLLDLH